MLKTIWDNIKLYVLIAGVLAALAFGLSKITLSQQQQSTQNMATTQLVQNQNINVVWAGQTWLITNESYVLKRANGGDEILEIINSLNYYQQTRMHVANWGVYYPVTPAVGMRTITNFVSNQNFNTNSIKIEPKFNFKKYLPWGK